MKNASHLTEGYEPVLARQICLTAPGMAHFAATGPFGSTCSGCSFWGYWRQVRNVAGDTVGTQFRRSCCGKYFELTRKHGPGIPGNTEACRYFQQRVGSASD
jgi:hypothetical protein